MHDFAPLPRLLAALSLTIPLLSAAQAPAMTDAERARRDADKVLNFIKFHAVKARPVAEPADKPRKPAAPGPQRAASPMRHAEAAPAEPAVAETAHASASTQTLPTADATTPPAPAQPAASFGTSPVSAPAAAAATIAPPESVAEPDTEEPEEVALQLQRFVEPVLTASAQATLVGRPRNVTVRFTVEPNGTVSKADALADAPRRLARPAVDAVLQWQFAPLPQPRTVDVEIAFRPG
ncbi:energy transducer TonB [Roseateles sp. LYH14W]|uniref:Energy transducer TonB n=1 Tax=Pelomonas parva TaxID=3299032 RepID=A0ABW7F5V7_9BURK